MNSSPLKLTVKRHLIIFFVATIAMFMITMSFWTFLSNIAVQPLNWYDVIPDLLPKVAICTGILMFIAVLIYSVLWLYSYLLTKKDA